MKRTNKSDLRECSTSEGTGTIGDPLALNIYDSATRSVRLFEPRVAGTVGIYDCGPTVWSAQHIGNLYRYVVADVVRRSFEYLGYSVTQVMNITDVGAILGDVDEGEDRIEIAARREGRDPDAIATEYTARFMEDRRKLNILEPHVLPKATEHIPEMLALIQQLIDKGHAYTASDGVYFDISTFPGYGTRLNRELPEDRLAGARIEINPNKRNPADFALWRGAKPSDLQRWESPWGSGKPGWHIECSAMSMRYLGDQFDLHSGGEDHLFPHHECEIAQSESATGKSFAQYWMHVYFLRVDGGGMHKSLGNVHLVSDLESWGFDALAFRLLVLGVGYRKGLDFTKDALAQAQKRLDRWRARIASARERAVTIPDLAEDDALRAQFVSAIADDFNTPRALAAAEEALRLFGSDDNAASGRGLALLLDMDLVLGLSLGADVAPSSDLSSNEQSLLDERAGARAAGDYSKADELRAQLESIGIRIRDTKEGQRWERSAVKGSNQ